MVGSGKVKLRVFPLIISLVAEGGDDIGSSNGVPDENRYVKIEGYPLGDKLFGSEFRTSQMKKFISILMVQIWDSHLVQNLELR